MVVVVNRLPMGKPLDAELIAAIENDFIPTMRRQAGFVSFQLVRNSDAKVPFTITVVDSSEVNAFALPGGYFYVNTGLILAADNEAELAGVMAHEIAHVAARHATHNMSRRELFNLCSLPAVFVATLMGVTSPGPATP